MKESTPVLVLIATLSGCDLGPEEPDYSNTVAGEFAAFDARDGGLVPIPSGYFNLHVEREACDPKLDVLSGQRWNGGCLYSLIDGDTSYTLGPMKAGSWTVRVEMLSGRFGGCRLDVGHFPVSFTGSGEHKWLPIRLELQDGC